MVMTAKARKEKRRRVRSLNSSLEKSNAAVKVARMRAGGYTLTSVGSLVFIFILNKDYRYEFQGIAVAPTGSDGTNISWCQEAEGTFTQHESSI